jgi:hypothetical protein
MPPTPAMGNHSPLAGFYKVDPAPVDSFGLRPRRHGNQQLLPPSPMPVGPFATLPPPGPKVLAPPQCPKIPARGVANEHHIPPMPAIAAIRPTARHMRLPPKAHAPVPTGSALNPDFGFVIHANAA